jgi:hypothetical protein
LAHDFDLCRGLDMDHLRFALSLHSFFAVDS